MKAFIAYRFTGEDPAVIEPLLRAIVGAFEKKGITAYCTLLDGLNIQEKGVRDIMDHAFSVIDDSHFLFVVQTSEAKSEGMIMEVGYCRAKEIPIFVAKKAGVGNTHISQVATASFVWTDTEDLCRKIQRSPLVVSI